MKTQRNYFVLLAGALLGISLMAGSAGAQSTNDPHGSIKSDLQEFGPTDNALVLIFQDQNPWGTTSNQQVLNNLGVPYIIAPRTAMGTMNLYQYDVIIMASQQPTAYYQEYQAQANRFEDYLFSGGILEFHCATYGSYFWPPLTLPGGVTQIWHLQDTNFIADSSHPITAGVPYTMTGSYSSHEHFHNYPVGTDIITIDADSMMPTTIEYEFGSGVVIATGQTWEYYYGSGSMALLLSNTISYSLSLANQDSFDVMLTPLNPPIQIPSTGGSFDYTVALQNNCGGSVTVEAWINVLLPNGVSYGPVLGPVSLLLPPGVPLTRNRTQFVPAGAPAGTYYYRAFAGTYPAVIWDHDSFIFTKLAAGDSDPGMDDWANTGQPFGDMEKPSIAHSSSLITSCRPNPFNPTTTISFGLPEAGMVKLAVYDLLGRQVALLVNGYRPAGQHEITFDAGNLASGIYVYRLEAGNFSAVKKMALMK